ncbi:MAG TPA: tetratricopeptide repeat protein, partial [Candidatus Berkiella sp.]|nr:tetratricopeptide repeat protein [Candidatus Berkiella sp.]
KNINTATNQLIQEKGFILNRAKIDDAASTYPLSLLSIASLHANKTSLSHLLEGGHRPNVSQSKDCNLLSWCVLFYEREQILSFIKYIKKNNIYILFEDGTQEKHVNMLLNEHSYKSDYRNEEFRTWDGLSLLYYLLLSPLVCAKEIHSLFETATIETLIKPNILNPCDNSNRRIGRYYYFAGFYLARYKLYKLATQAYQRGTVHYNNIANNQPDDLKELAFIYNSLGGLYCVNKQWEDAIQCYQMAVDTHSKIQLKSLPDHQDLANYRSNLSGYLCEEIEEHYFSRFIAE